MSHRTFIGAAPAPGNGTGRGMSGVSSTHRGRTIAVALHGIEPATFERCAVMRDWLDDHGVDRVTLLVIPARDLHPVGERSPAMVRWLNERRVAGDSIGQHGFRHVGLRSPGPARGALARAQGHRPGEFYGLDCEETRRAVNAGWRVLKLAGIEPEGFVAPAYAYTAALREALTHRYRWWASLLRIHRGRPFPEDPFQHPRPPRAPEPLAPAWSLAAGGPLRRFVSPSFVRAGALIPTSTLRIDLHPADLRYPRHMMALEWALQRARFRAAVTYQELAEP
jgi:Uncharacterized protein conserved in bacteria (DUF2334)